MTLLSEKETYNILHFFLNDDCYLSDMLDGDSLEEFLSFLMYFNIIWIASDDRILLTLIGEQILQDLALSSVDFGKKTSKVKGKYGYKKYKQ